MAEIVEQLMEIYSAETHTFYQRPQPQPRPSIKDYSHQHYDVDRKSIKIGWRPPQYWLMEALKDDNRNPEEAYELLYPKYSSRKAQVTADLVSYEEAKRIWDKLIDEGRTDLLVKQAMIYLGKAAIHQAIGDLPGGIGLSDEAIKILTSLAKKDNAPHRRLDLELVLVIAYATRAMLTAELGDKSRALNLLNQVLEIYESLAYEGFVALPCTLSDVYEHKAILLNEIEEDVTEEQLKIVDHVIFLRKLLLRENKYVDNDIERLADLPGSLARAFMNKATFLQKISRHEEAIKYLDSCIKIRESLNDPFKEYGLASAYFHKAISVEEVSGPNEALTLYDLAIESAERQIQEHDSYDVNPFLATVYWAKAVMLRADGQLSQYIIWSEKSISLYEHLVRDEGQNNLLFQLTSVYQEHAAYLADLHQWHQALSLFDRGILLCERLLAYGEDTNIRVCLAELSAKKGITLVNAGKPKDAMDLIDQASVVFEKIDVKNQKNLLKNLVEVYGIKAHAMCASGNLTEAQQLCDRAIALLEPIDDAKSVGELLVSSIGLYNLKAVINVTSGNCKDAIELYDTLISLFSKIGEEHLTAVQKKQLAEIYNNKGTTLLQLGKKEMALQALVEAIKILQPLVENLGRFDFADHLAKALMNKGSVLTTLGQKEEAHQSYDDAIKLFEQMVNEKSRFDLANDC